MLIVHMSDLHCGPRLKREILQKAIDEINDIGPDMVLCGHPTSHKLLYKP